MSETATGNGMRYTGTSNWFMVTKFTTPTVPPVNLIAGQQYDAGDITFTRNGTTTIKITLHEWLPFRERGKQPEDPELLNGATAVHGARTIQVQVQL